jgi:hypothetical protein
MVQSPGLLLTDFGKDKPLERCMQPVSQTPWYGAQNQAKFFVL